MSSETGSKNLNSFAFETIDERDKLNENRLVGEN